KFEMDLQRLSSFINNVYSFFTTYLWRPLLDLLEVYFTLSPPVPSHSTPFRHVFEADILPSFRPLLHFDRGFHAETNYKRLSLCDQNTYQARLRTLNETLILISAKLNWDWEIPLNDIIVPMFRSGNGNNMRLST